MILGWLLVGCLNQSRFEERFAVEQCRWAQECEVLDLEGFSTLLDCERERTILPDDCESYDQKTAKECLKELRESTCEDGLNGPPKVCNRVCKN